MAMLAEPRRRQKWLISPRGKPLHDDENNFGNKMLMKMGWSVGKGLGAKESGEKEFVKVNFKNDKMGIGCEDRNDQWTKHETDFNSLLKSLAGEENSEGETNGQDDDGFAMPRACFGGVEKKKKKKKKLEELSGESLEEKSKNSRARVHYKKFTRGKDTSRYSEKDLANIFGKKVEEKDDAEDVKISYGVVYNVEEDAKKNKEKEEEEDDDKVDKLKFGIQTINTGTSMVDYFKQKMEKFKNKSLFSNVEIKKEEKLSIKEEVVEPKIKKEKNNKQVARESEEETITTVKLEIKEESVSEPEELVQPKMKKQKKNKKVTKEEQEEEVIIKAEIKEESPSESEELIQPKIKKEKKNKKVVKEDPEPITIVKSEIKEESIEEPEIITITESEEPIKKKKSKKRKFEELADPIEIPSKKLKEITSDPVIVEIEDSPPKKKKKESISEEPSESSTIYQISTSNATVYQHLNPAGFKNANLPAIPGYGLTTKVELDIIERPKGLKPHWTELKYGIEENAEGTAISTQKKKKKSSKIKKINLFTF